MQMTMQFLMIQYFYNGITYFDIFSLEIFYGTRNLPEKEIFVSRKSSIDIFHRFCYETLQIKWSTFVDFPLQYRSILVIDVKHLLKAKHKWSNII